MKKFSDKIKESKEYSIHSMDNEQLEERLEFLRMELKETQDEIMSIVSIIKSRSDIKDRETFENLPKNIYDLNKEQLEFVLVHTHGITTYRYTESQRYWYQLFGFFPSGTRNDQVCFNLTLSSFENANGDFTYNSEFDKSFNLLKDNLKEFRFGVLGNHDDNSYTLSIVVTDNIEIYDGNTPINDFYLEDTEELVKFLFERDKRYSDDY